MLASFSHDLGTGLGLISCEAQPCVDHLESVDHLNLNLCGEEFNVQLHCESDTVQMCIAGKDWSFKFHSETQFKGF